MLIDELSLAISTNSLITVLYFLTLPITPSITILPYSHSHPFVSSNTHTKDSCFGPNLIIHEHFKANCLKIQSVLD